MTGILAAAISSSDSYLLIAASALIKCAGGTFLAGSARAVPHAKRGVSRAGSMRGTAAADGQIPTLRPKIQIRLFVGFGFFFFINVFSHSPMDFY